MFTLFTTFYTLSVVSALGSGPYSNSSAVGGLGISSSAGGHVETSQPVSSTLAQVISSQSKHSPTNSPDASSQVTHTAGGNEKGSIAPTPGSAHSQDSIKGPQPQTTSADAANGAPAHPKHSPPAGNGGGYQYHSSAIWVNSTTPTEHAAAANPTGGSDDDEVTTTLTTTQVKTMVDVIYTRNGTAVTTSHAY